MLEEAGQRRQVRGGRRCPKNSGGGIAPAAIAALIEAAGLKVNAFARHFEAG